MKTTATKNQIGTKMKKNNIYDKKWNPKKKKASKTMKGIHMKEAKRNHIVKNIYYSSPLRSWLLEIVALEKLVSS